LVAKPLSSLGAETKRLIIVPDGALFSLPFDVLRPPGDRAEPLGIRYETAVVPSATVLLRWRRTVAPPAQRSVLVLADPALPGAAATAATLRDAALGERVKLGRLPAAGREGWAVARMLAPTSVLLEGSAATERSLARADLGSFAVLHFAAHAIADGLHPQRSAVLLAPADAGEDGLLQGREIARLPLAGRTIFLSACRTAAGAVVAGEGTLSLARAFQQAGARAVVGSRWPLRDEEAAAMVGEVYRQIAGRHHLGAALRAARRRAWEEGRPAAAWAALLLMGEPGVDVLAGVAINPPTQWPAVAVGIALGLGTLGTAALAWRRAYRHWAATLGRSRPGT
jgi:CHAT domain-containing protein